ncbi:hypothetical protein ABKN59_002032 [Abortiporus biennis]
MSSAYLNSPLSPPRPSSRPSSRNSIRSSGNGRSSPIVTLQDEQVAIRTQMSTLKHNIRQQQAQLHTLESTLLRGPRPLPAGVISSPTSPSDYDFISPSSNSYFSQASTASTSTSPSSFNPTPKMQKRNSFEVLQGLAGPDSSLPLPRRDSRANSFGEENSLNGITEGIPTGVNKRAQSPTRTLSRIPVSSVGNIRALAEEHSDMSNGAMHHGPPSLNLGASTSSNLSMSSATSPNRRASFAPGNTTKVLADLQAGVLNAKNALENTKAQLRLSQRQVSQLTRQTEDLKEVRERLRLENEGLNNVVARKERLLQEVLERARKAEAEVVSLRSQLKSETTTSKKSLREMEAQVAESSAKSQKSEREYITLRDSIKSLVESFKTDNENLREEMKKRETKVKAEAEEVRKKYTQLAEEVRQDRETSGSGEVKRLITEHEKVRKEVEDRFTEEMEKMKAEVVRTSKEGDEAAKTAKHLADELARLRRMMRASVTPSVTSIPQPVKRNSGAPPTDGVVPSS